MRKALGIIGASLVSSAAIVALEFLGWLKMVQGSDQVPDWNFIRGAMIGVWLVTFIVVASTLGSSLSDERTPPDAEDDLPDGGR